MRCPSCAHVNPREASFCESCGNPLDVKSRPSGTSGMLFYSIVGVLILVIGALIYQVSKTQSADDYDPAARAGVQTTPSPLDPRPTFVKAERPVAHFEGFAPLTVYLKPVSFELPKDYGNLAFKWEFSPGKTQLYNETRGRARFTYSQPGIYRPKLLISDQAGEIARQAWEIYVFPPAASAAMQALEASPHSENANLAMAKTYLSMGAVSEGMFYSFRAHFASWSGQEPVTLLVENLETLLGMGEYLHHALRRASELEGGSGAYTEKLNSQIEIWKEDRDRQRLSLANAGGRPDTATASSLILSLASLNEYEEAIKVIGDSGLTESQYNNLAWFSLNLGKVNEAKSYAERQFDKAPGDPYAVQYLMMVSALEGDFGKAREHLKTYISLDPERGHVLTVAADAIMFASKGLPPEFVWEICDELRVLM